LPFTLVGFSVFSFGFGFQVRLDLTVTAFVTPRDTVTLEKLTQHYIGRCALFVAARANKAVGLICLNRRLAAVVDVEKAAVDPVLEQRQVGRVSNVIADMPLIKVHCAAFKLAWISASFLCFSA
jgi:hypothetical protein